MATRKSNTGNVNATKRSSQAKTKIDKNAKINKLVDQEPVNRTYICTACGHEYSKQKSNFLISHSPLYVGNNGYLPVCKKCIDAYYYNLVEVFSGNEEKAMRRICEIADWYYLDELFAATRKISADRSRVSAYPSKANINQGVDRETGRHKTFIDTLKDEAGQTIDTSTDIAEAMQNRELKTPMKTIKFFGMGFKPDEYKYLQDQYDDWVARHECKTKVQEELFKNICIAQLNIQKAEQTGLKVPEAMKAFQDLLGSANLKPTQTNDNALADQNTFGTLIKKWETTRPISEPEEEWKDVDHIIWYISVYFFGHLCKVVGLKNRYSKLYEEEMAKFRVEKPEYEEDDEALFDSIFANKSDTENIIEETAVNTTGNTGDSNGS